MVAGGARDLDHIEQQKRAEQVGQPAGQLWGRPIPRSRSASASRVTSSAPRTSSRILGLSSRSVSPKRSISAATSPMGNRTSTSQRLARSTSRRNSRYAVCWATTGTVLSNDSTSDHNASRPKTDRATV
jgi:hypothetical protein